MIAVEPPPFDIDPGPRAPRLNAAAIDHAKAQENAAGARVDQMVRDELALLEFDRSIKGRSPPALIVVETQAQADVLGRVLPEILVFPVGYEFYDFTPRTLAERIRSGEWTNRSTHPLTPAVHQAASQIARLTSAGSRVVIWLPRNEATFLRVLRTAAANTGIAIENIALMPQGWTSMGASVLLAWSSRNFPVRPMQWPTIDVEEDWTEWAAKMWEAIISMIISAKAADRLPPLGAAARDVLSLLAWLGGTGLTKLVIDVTRDGTGSFVGEAMAADEQALRLLGRGLFLRDQPKKLTDHTADFVEALFSHEPAARFAQDLCGWPSGAAREDIGWRALAAVPEDVQVLIANGVFRSGAPAIESLAFSCEFTAHDDVRIYGRRRNWRPRELATVFFEEERGMAARMLLGKAAGLLKAAFRRRWQVVGTRATGLSRPETFVVSTPTDMAVPVGQALTVRRAPQSAIPSVDLWEVIRQLRALKLAASVNAEISVLSAAHAHGFVEAHASTLQLTARGRAIRHIALDRWSGVLTRDYTNAVQEHLALATKSDVKGRRDALLQLLADLDARMA